MEDRKGGAKMALGLLHPRRLFSCVPAAVVWAVEGEYAPEFYDSVSLRPRLECLGYCLEGERVGEGVKRREWFLGRV